MRNSRQRTTEGGISVINRMIRFGEILEKIKVFNNRLKAC